MITTQQFNVLLKNKTIKRNSMIEVQKIKSVPISNKYVKKIVYNDKGFISKVKYNEDKDTFLIGYVKATDHEKMLVCELKDISKIEGQDIDRYYQSFVDMLANTNPTIIDIPTNVQRDVIGKKTAKLGDYELFEGFKLILKNDVNPEFNDKILNVRIQNKAFVLKGNTGRPKKRK